MEKLNLDMPLETSLGQRARIICRDRKGDETKIVALVTESDGSESVCFFDAQGKSNVPDFNLVNRKPSNIYWLNVYENGVSRMFVNRDKADNFGYGKSRIAQLEVCIKGKKVAYVNVHHLDNSGCNRGHTTQVINWEQRSRDYFASKGIKTSWDFDVESIGEYSDEDEARDAKAAYLEAMDKND